MSNTRHTPGPWKVLEHSWSDTSIVAPNFDHAICCLDINHATEESQTVDEAQMATNARLIAAAPDLLEALKDMLDSHEDACTGYGEGAADKARDAIAKATGEQA